MTKTTKTKIDLRGDGGRRTTDRERRENTRERERHRGRGKRGIERRKWGKWRKEKSLDPDISARDIARTFCHSYRENVLALLQ